MKKININFIIGAFALIAGVILCVQILDVNININFGIIWWAFVTMVGVVMVINDGKISISSSIIIVIGLWYMLKDMGIISKPIFSLLWPILLIVIGLNLMFSKNIFTKAKAKNVDTKGILNYSGILGGVEEKIQTKDFKGLCATALFGSVSLDLREIEIQAKEVYIEATGIFGGITLLLPNSKYNVVEGESIALLGGTENKYKGDYVQERTTIYLNTKAVFGGIEVK